MWEIFFQGHIVSTIGDALRSLGMDNNKLLHMRKKWNFFRQLDAACVLCLVFWSGLYTVVSIVSWFTKLVRLYLECRHFLVVSTVHGTSIGGFVVAELVRDFFWVICKVHYLAYCSNFFFLSHVAGFHVGHNAPSCIDIVLLLACFCGTAAACKGSCPVQISINKDCCSKDTTFWWFPGPLGCCRYALVILHLTPDPVHSILSNCWPKLLLVDSWPSSPVAQYVLYKNGIVLLYIQLLGSEPRWSG